MVDVGRQGNEKLIWGQLGLRTRSAVRVRIDELEG